MGRKAKDPGAMLEMAAPEILAKMEKPEVRAEPKTRRMRLSRGFKQAERELGRAVTAPKPEPAPTVTDNDGDDPFAEARRAIRGKHWNVGELDDYEEIIHLPPTGKCTCGGKPYTWTNASGYSQSKSNPEIGFFCSHTAHGGNGKFWLFPLFAEPKKRGRPRKVKVEPSDE